MRGQKRHEFDNESWPPVIQIVVAVVQPANAYTAGASPTEVMTANFNRDGKLDLAVNNLGSDTVSILLGNGDGTFQSQVQYATASMPQGVAIGDYNGDGNIDLAVNDLNCVNFPACGPGMVSILLGSGDGTFQTHVEYPTGPSPDSVTVADFNGDGILDLVTASGTYGTNNFVSVLLGNGDGTFQPNVNYTTGTVRSHIVTLRGAAAPQSSTLAFFAGGRFGCSSLRDPERSAAGALVIRRLNRVSSQSQVPLLTAAALHVIRHEGFRPKRHPDFGNAAGGEKALELIRRKQRQFLDLPLGYMCSEQPVVFPLQRTRQELDERQVIVALERIPVVGSGHKPAFSNSCYFVGKLFLTARDMLNHRV